MFGAVDASGCYAGYAECSSVTRATGGALGDNCTADGNGAYADIAQENVTLAWSVSLDREPLEGMVEVAVVGEPNPDQRPGSEVVFAYNVSAEPPPET